MLQEVFKILITDLNVLKQRPRTVGQTGSSINQSIDLYCITKIVSCGHCGSRLSVVSLIGADQWCMFSTFKSSEFKGHSWGVINFLLQLSGSTCTMNTAIASFTR